MFAVQGRLYTSEVQAISEVAKLKETRTGTKIESLFQMSGPKSFGGQLLVDHSMSTLSRRT